MSGKVLLVDDVSTNRIILKVKLSAAYYDVAQAASLEEAEAAIAEFGPDLVLVNARLVKDDLTRAMSRMLPGADRTATPVIILSDISDKDFNISALQAGFKDVITRNMQDSFLLARLRSLLRQRRHSDDLRKHSTTARAFGFAEKQHGFSRPAVVTLVTDDTAWGVMLGKALGREVPHRIRSVGADRLMSPDPRQNQPHGDSDVLIADLRDVTREDGIRLIADLRVSADLRDCPVLPLLDAQAGELAATLLDMGVSEVLFDSRDPGELALRLMSQIEQKRASDEMRSQIKDSLQAAVTDPLTGLYNRRYALSYLKCLLADDAHAQKPFAVIVADLDHFKKVNDSYGHAAGDKVLSSVAATLCFPLQRKDLVARIGGEEFLIVIPDTTRDQAQRLAQQLCGAVRDMSLTLPGRAQPVGVTISLGVTIGTADDVEGSTAERKAQTLLELADRALYRSKAEGRNTVTLSEKDAA